MSREPLVRVRSSIHWWNLLSPLRPDIFCRPDVELQAVVKRYSVVHLGGSPGHEAFEDVSHHILRIAIERMPPAATSTRLRPEQVAGPHLDTLSGGWNIPLPGSSRIE